MPEDWAQRLEPNKQYTISVRFLSFYLMHIHSWLMRQFIHFDANFRLVSDKKTKSSYSGHGLWEGLGFFVKTDSYQTYLDAVSRDKQDVRPLAFIL
jgi:hypothetical protein